MSKAFHSQFGGPAYYQPRGEMAPLGSDTKIDGGDNPSAKVTKYNIKIEFSGDGEFYCRVSVRGKDYFSGR